MKNLKMKLKIGTKVVGDKNPVFIVAELSCNHLQKYEIALKSIEMIKKAGADAIKLQTYTPDTITLDIKNKYFQIKQNTIWDKKTFYELYKEAYTPWEWQPKIKKYAEDLGLVCFSSAFDKTAVDFLKKIKMPAYKVASFEITDLPLIRYMASVGKPMILSTGVARLEDIKEAVKECRKVGNNQIAILKCTSAYPAPLEDMNLRTIGDIGKRFNVVVGLSDHTLGQTVPVAATVLGAKIIEKHFILDRRLGGPDSKFSLNFEEFKNMVKAVRETEKALGKVTYKLTPKMKKSREFSRSLFVSEDVIKGEKFTQNNVRSVRPAFGLPPKYLDKIVGKTARKDIKRGTPLRWRLIK